MTNQMPLPLTLLSPCSWDHFYVGENQALLAYLQALPHDADNTYLWGSTGAGKTYLLQTTCQQLISQGKQVFYFDCAHHEEMSPELIAELGAYDVVCFDRLDKIAGNHAWELALFNLYNQLRDQRKLLLIAADTAPSAIKILLPDLKSRLQQSIIYQVKPLSHAQLSDVIQLKLTGYGFKVSKDIVQYIADRTIRDISILSDTLAKLNQASLSAQKNLTKPFIKKILAW